MTKMIAWHTFLRPRCQPRPSTLKVAKGCTKNEIKKAIESLFDVKVLQVNTQNPPIKRKMNRQRPGKQLIVRRPKRAVVTLVEGDAIPLFEEEEEGEEDGGESQE